MSTRDEVLSALTEHPDGLTTKQLAPHCPACECDAQIVGRTIALLRSENVIHAGTELREGGAIWLFGPGEKKEIAESKMTLAYRPDAKPASVAARAIAQMRTGSRSAEERPLARTTSQPAAPQPAGTPHQEPTMKPKKTVAARVVEALKKHGHCTLEQLAKHADTTVGTLYTMTGTLKKLHGIVKHPAADGKPATFAIGGKPPPSAEPRAPKPKAPEKARAPRAAVAPRRADLPAPTNGHAAFAINEAGELGIEKEGGKMSLDPTEFERLRGFIERTKPVWSGESA